MKVGIAGAGIMGRLLAFALQKAGWDVTLFDVANQSSVSFVAAGLLTPLVELEKNDLIIYQLGSVALKEHWPCLLQALDSDIFFKHDGSIVLAHPRDSAELTRLMCLIADKLNATAIPSSPAILSRSVTPHLLWGLLDDGKPIATLGMTKRHEMTAIKGSDLSEAYQRLDQAALLQLEPSLTSFQTGFYFPNEGQLDCQAVMSVLTSLLKEKTHYHECAVDDVSPGVIKTVHETHYFDLVCDCRGLGATQFFPDLRSIRGELVWLTAPHVDIRRPIRLMHPRYSLYIVPRPHHVYLVGASEIEADDHSEISVRTLLELLTAAYSVHPGFAEARVIKTSTHCRPALADHLPRIKYTDGLLAINGLYRHGFLIAPTLLVEAMAWITSGLSHVHYPQLWEKI
ncbi:MAG: hypothetical protein A3F43_05085 [Gammaproteobacteria bacterium RIFCSPHIGHO2_12_FULL_42_10]|nr:MAG: hypothetical protein A3F43_05085 [Gammaproteobacteria bacterium RIFCSPHIGHO2_12_FULL_42_10]